METIDDEVLEHGLDFIERQAAAETPFFVWLNTTHMHLRTHTKPESLGQAGRWQSPYHDTMIDHDKLVGAVLDKLDELGIAENTIVVYSTDNGPHMNSWPDGGMTPFRSEKNTNWEGAFRVPELIRWPGKIAAGTVSNEIVQHHDWLPTFLAAAGDPDIVEKLKAGHDVGGTTFKVHIDGYNLLPYLTGEVDKSPRPGLVYYSDDGDVLALRFDNWKVVFMEQRAQGTLQIWAEPFVALRVPKLFNLRTDPFERADVTSNTYYDWFIDNDYIALAATAVVTQFLETFKEFPPRQEAASFTIDQVVEEARDGARGRALSMGEPLCVLERRIRQGRRASLRRACELGRSAAGGAGRGLRQRRHALVREAAADPGRLHPSSTPRDGRGRRRAPREAALESGVRAGLRVAREGDGGALQRRRHQRADAARRGDRRACGHQRRRLRGAGGLVPALGEAPDARPRLPRVRLRADGRAAALPRRQRVRELHRLRRRPRLHAADQRRDVRHPARSGDRELDGARLHRATTGAARSCASPRPTCSTTARRSRSGSGAASAGGRCSRAGNSNGDIQMLDFAQHADKPFLRLLVLHDDAEREFAYTAGAERALERARAKSWTVVSIKNDWSTVFADVAP